MCETKRCSRCGETKPVEEFARNRRLCDGLQYWCRSCTRAHREATRGRHYPPETSRFTKLNDPDWVGRQYQHELRSPDEIAEELGCHRATVFAALRRHQIPRIPREPRQILREKMEAGV